VVQKMIKEKRGSVLRIVLFIVIFTSIGAVLLLHSLSDSAFGLPTPSAAVISEVIGSGELPLWVLVVFLGVLVALVLGILVYWQFARPYNRLKRKLSRLLPMLVDGTSEQLKSNYLDVYNLYLKLSDKHKQNFYSRITRIREEIEDHLKAENAVKQMLDKAHDGDIDDQKMNYLTLYKQYQKLPATVQKKYYANIVQLRDRLERGTNHG